LTLKDDENIKEKLSQLISENSEKYFGFKVSTDFILEILNLILNCKNLQMKKDLKKSLSKNLIFQTIQVFLRKVEKKIGEEENMNKLTKKQDLEDKKPQQKLTEETLPNVFMSCLELFFSIKSRNIQKIFINIIDIIQNLNLIDLKEIKRPIAIFDFLTVLLMKPTSENLRKSLENIMDVMGLNESTRGLITLLLFSPLYNTAVQSKDKCMETYHQLDYFFHNIVSEIEEDQNDKEIDTRYVEKLSKTFLFFFRSIKLHFTKKDYERTIKVIMKDQEGKPAFEENQAKVFEKLVNVAKVIGNIFILNKDFENELDELAQHYEISNQTIKELILLITDNFWQNFYQNKYDALAKSSILAIVSKAWEQDNKILIGYLTLINRDTYNHHLYDFFLFLILKKEGDIDKKEEYLEIFKYLLLQNQSNNLEHNEISPLIGKKKLFDEKDEKIVSECWADLEPLFNAKLKGKFDWRNVEKAIDLLSEKYDFNKEPMKYFTLIFVCPKKSFKKQIKEGIQFFLKELESPEKEVGFNQILTYILQCEKFFTGESISHFFDGFLSESFKNHPTILMRSLLDMKSNWNSTNIPSFLSVYSDMHWKMREHLNKLPDILEPKHLNTFFLEVVPKEINQEKQKKLESIQACFLTNESKKTQKKEKVIENTKKTTLETLKFWLPESKKKIDIVIENTKKTTLETLKFWLPESKKEIDLAFKLMLVFANNSTIDEKDGNWFGNNKFNINYKCLLSLRYFYTKEPFVFAEHMIKHFNELYRDTQIRENDFGSILSLFSETPSLKGAKKILNEPIHALKLIIFIRDIHLQSNKAQVIQKILKNDNKFFVKLCKKLNIDYNELVFFLKFLFCSLKLTEMPDFIRLFGFEKFIKIELMVSLMNFFPLNEQDFPDQKSLIGQLMRSNASRNYLYSFFKIKEPEFFNLIYDMNHGKFCNIFNFFFFFFFFF